MATAVLRSHDALDNRMHLDAFAHSPSKPRRRRHPKPAAAGSPAAKVSAVTSPAPKPAAVASPAPKTAVHGRRSPPARPVTKQPSPTKEKPNQRLVMEEVRILKRGEEPPAPAPVVAQVAPVDQRLLCSTSRIGPQEPAVVPTKIVAVADAPGYAGPAFSAAAPEPSSLPFPAFFLRRAEAEATRGLRCLLRIGELS